MPQQDDSNEVHIFDLDTYDFVYVVVREPDGDELDFHWRFPAAVDEYIDTVQTDTHEWTSTFTILNPDDPGLDGRTIHLTILDDSPVNRIEVTYQMRSSVEAP